MVLSLQGFSEGITFLADLAATAARPIWSKGDMNAGLEAASLGSTDAGRRSALDGRSTWRRPASEAPAQAAADRPRSAGAAGALLPQIGAGHQCRACMHVPAEGPGDHGTNQAPHLP